MEAGGSEGRQIIECDQGLDAEELENFSCQPCGLSELDSGTIEGAVEHAAEVERRGAAGASKPLHRQVI